MTAPATAPRRGRRAGLPAFLRTPVHAPVRLPPKHPPDILALPQKAAGSGLVPWVYDYDRREETFFLWLAVPQDRRRGLSIPAAHTLARQLREAEWQLHETAAARSGGAGGLVPFDLHALQPVPGAILRLGPDHPEALRWMWQHWGTTWTLRRVERVHNEPERFAVRFFSADWTPWPVLQRIQQQWPELTWQVQVDYG